MYGNQVTKRPDSWEDPADWDTCDEHETTYPRHGKCPECEEDFIEPDDDPGPIIDRDCDYWNRTK